MKPSLNRDVPQGVDSNGMPGLQLEPIGTPQVKRTTRRPRIQSRGKGNRRTRKETSKVPPDLLSERAHINKMAKRLHSTGTVMTVSVSIIIRERLYALTERSVLRYRR